MFGTTVASSDDRMGWLVIVAPLIALASYAYAQNSRSSPTRDAITYVLFFLTAGPLLLPVVMILAGVMLEAIEKGLSISLLQALLALPFTVVAGAWFWWRGVLDESWVLTIGPTAMAGLSLWAVQRAICRRYPALLRTRMRRVVVLMSLGSLLSTLVFVMVLFLVNLPFSGPKVGYSFLYVAMVGGALGSMIGTWRDPDT